MLNNTPLRFEDTSHGCVEGIVDMVFSLPDMKWLDKTARCSHERRMPFTFVALPASARLSANNTNLCERFRVIGVIRAIRGSFFPSNPIEPRLFI
jgi:hypothetical protein